MSRNTSYVILTVGNPRASVFITDKVDPNALEWCQRFRQAFGYPILNQHIDARTRLFLSISFVGSDLQLVFGNRIKSYIFERSQILKRFLIGAQWNPPLRHHIRTMVVCRSAIDGIVHRLYAKLQTNLLYHVFQFQDRCAWTHSFKGELVGVQY